MVAHPPTPMLKSLFTALILAGCTVAVSAQTLPAQPSRPSTPIPPITAVLPTPAPLQFDPPTIAPTYITPTLGTLSSRYGWRWGRLPSGIDLAAAISTPTVAAASGTVSYAQWNSSGYGNLIEIKHADGSITRYAHLSRMFVKSGDPVIQGQLIAEVGSTGHSTGPHLHFELHLAGQGAVNPLIYLP